MWCPAPGARATDTAHPEVLQPLLRRCRHQDTRQPGRLNIPIRSNDELLTFMRAAEPEAFTMMADLG